jgi:hypothetical protein
MKPIFFLSLLLCFSIILQAQVSKTVSITAGGLAGALTTEEKNTVTNLTITGTINAQDFKTMRFDVSNLSYLNLSGVTIVAYTGTGGTAGSGSVSYPANAVPAYGFYYNHGLTTVVLPSSIQIIDESAFSTCTDLASINIPEGTTTIGFGAFGGCAGLTSISIPKSVTSIGVFAFNQCGSITVHADNPNYSSADGVLFNKDKTILLQYPHSKPGSYTIPSSVGTIGPGAFSNCAGITSIIIPSSVYKIESGAFGHCGLSSIEIPSSVTTIMSNALANFNGTINVNASNPNYSSSDGVLYNRMKSELIQCPTSKTGSFSIPLTVSTIGIYAFNNCSHLTSVTIPSTVTTIGYSVFCYCESLLSINIPSSVTSIGSNAFNNCPSLTTLLVERSTPLDLNLSSNVFYNSNLTRCKLFVPYGTSQLYANTDKWKDFSNIIEISTLCEVKKGFTYTQDFSSGTLPDCWSVFDSLKTENIWTFNNPGSRTINTTTHANGFAIIDSDHIGEGKTQNCDLISPVFDFSNYATVTLKFEHYLDTYPGSMGTLLYSTDNGYHWITYHSWFDTSNPATFTANLSVELAGKSQVLFKWNYIGEWAIFWAIDDVAVTAGGVTKTLSVPNKTISAGESTCFNATDTITVAGSGTTVNFLNGSTVDLIAGKAIRFLPGFHAAEGSNTHASITTTGTFCDGASGSPIVEQPVEKSATNQSASETQIVVPEEKMVKVYPNPNNGQFTLELTNIESGAVVNIYNVVGAKVYQATLTNEAFQKVNISDIKKGIYFIKIMVGKEQFSKKMVVN